MTPQEQQLLQGLTDRVNQTQLNDKDPEAEQFIFQQLGRNTDSLYILAQTVLVQQYALDQAKQQLEQAKLDLDHARQVAQQAAQQPVKHTSFLGSLLGTDQPSAPPPPPAYQPVQTYAPPPPGYGQPVAYGGPQYGAPQYGAPQYAPSGGNSFLRSAMTTATGVAAGALAFEGIESLMHGFGQHAGYGSGFDGGMGGGQPREEIINNYYGDSAPHEKGDLADRFAAAGDHPSEDIEDRRGFADTGDSGDNDTSDNFADDSSDDSGSYDDGGGSNDDSGF